MLIEKTLDQFSDKWPGILREGIDNKLSKIGYSRLETSIAGTLENPVIKSKIVGSLERKGFGVAQILRALEKF